MVNVEFCNDIIVGATKIRDAILKLETNKTCGADNNYAEHLKYASSRDFTMLAMCLKAFSYMELCLIV